MIKYGRVIADIKKSENGIFGATLSKVYFPDFNAEISAYTKNLSPQDVLVEVFCSLVGIQLGLPIPEPMIAASKDGKSLLFASSKIEFPDLTHKLDFDISNNVILTEQSVETLGFLLRWQFMSCAITFDEWIANPDRNMGNILWNGIDEFFLIDHNMAMRPKFTANEPIEPNQLMAAKLLINNDELSKQRLRQEISLIISNLNSYLPKGIATKLVCDYPVFSTLGIDKMVEFLENRIKYLSQISDQKIVLKQMSAI